MRICTADRRARPRVVRPIHQSHNLSTGRPADASRTHEVVAAGVEKDGERGSEVAGGDRAPVPGDAWRDWTTLTGVPPTCHHSHRKVRNPVNSCDERKGL